MGRLDEVELAWSVRHCRSGKKTRVFSSRPDLRSCSITDLADAVVQIRQHGREDSAVDVFDVCENFFHVGIGPLQRAMDRVVGEVEKEGLIVMAIDEVDGFAGERVGEVFGFHHWLASAHDRDCWRRSQVRRNAMCVLKMQIPSSRPSDSVIHSPGSALRLSMVVTPW